MTSATRTVVPPSLSDDEVLAVLLCEDRPATVWEVARYIGDGGVDRAAEILASLTARGALACYRAGLSRYYAAPRLALTDRGPALPTVIGDTLKEMTLGWRYHLVKHLPRPRLAAEEDA